MKINKVYIIIAVASVLILALSAFKGNILTDTGSANEGKIKFSHQLHAELDECQSCHSAVLEAKSLDARLLPDHDNCASCHEVDNSDECGTCHYEDNYEALVQTKSELIFDHNFHLNNSTMQCIDCHQGIAEVDYSWEASGKNPPMEQCYSCHNDISVASNACESCHISTVNLLPQDHKVAGFMRAHKFSASAFDADCMMCHDNQSCSDCHIATTGITETNMPDNFYQPYTPSNFVDGVRVQAITRVHDLNYRFTHGIESKGKTAECQSCHQVESFCASCHFAEGSGDYALGGVVPASHLKSTFKTIGVGSGGGDHASLARRDIERCASCHDVNGADPTCITCHLDSDGVQGTNPKTHANGFMRGEKGDWHDSMGSVCYNCHTSSGPQSTVTAGFCNYCHGI
jgi:hypothetical protein